MYNTKNYSEQGGDKLVIGGELEIQEGATVTGLDTTGTPLSPATEAELGGVLAAAKGKADTIEVKIGKDHKLYVPEYPESTGSTELPMASEDLLGGVAADSIGDDQTYLVECKIDPDTGKLYVSIPVATPSTLGGIKSAPHYSYMKKIECRVNPDNSQLYVEHFQAQFQEASTAEDVETLVTDFNALLSKLKAGSIMEAQ